MLRDIVLRPPAIGGFNLPRRRREGQCRGRRRGKIRTAWVHIGRGIQDVTNETVGTDKRMNAFIPGKEVMLRVQDRNVGDGR